MNSAAIRSDKCRMCRQDFNHRIQFWRLIALSGLMATIVLTCAACGPLPDFEVCGAPVTSCPNLTPEASQAAFDEVGRELAARGMIPNANICQFGYELAIDCVGAGSLDIDQLGEYRMLTQRIIIARHLDACGSALVLAHELIHWSAHRLMGVWTGEHEEPFYGYPSASSVETYVYNELVPQVCAERSEAP